MLIRLATARFLFVFLFFNNSIFAQAPAKLVKWYSIQQAQELNKKEPRKLFIDVYTDWCGWCKKMDAVTFENPIIAEYLNKTYYPVKFNAEMTDSVLYNGKEYVFVQSGMRGYHQLAAEWMGERMSFPTIVFVDERLVLMQAIPGFREAPELDRILKYFGDNYYRTTEYQIFSGSYVSPFGSNAGN